MSLIVIGTGVMLLGVCGVAYVCEKKNYTHRDLAKRQKQSKLASYTFWGALATVALTLKVLTLLNSSKELNPTSSSFNLSKYLLIPSFKLDGRSIRTLLTLL